jgi:hypothetical protein
MRFPFIVHASNIHTGENQIYGPFAGPPQLTYELLRANEDDGPPFEIFAWYDPQDIAATATDPNPHEYDSWIDQEGDTRYDGWRHLTRKPVPADPTVTYTKPDGPFWTDLFLCSEPEHIAEQHCRTH